MSIQFIRKMFVDSRFEYFLDLAVAKSLQSTRMVTDDADADADDVYTTTGYTC